MRKIIRFLLALALLAPLACKAQKIDDDKYNQWRSMETGPLKFSPKEYYWLLHNAYAHYQWHFAWLGSELRLHPEKSSARPLVPKRMLGNEADVMTKKYTSAEYDRMSHQLRQETAASAERNVDEVYSIFRRDFADFQDVISNGLLYCQKNGTEAIRKTVKELSDKNQLLCEEVAYVHRTGVGYELENGKREEQYLRIKDDMQELSHFIVRLVSYVKSTKK